MDLRTVVTALTLNHARPSHVPEQMMIEGGLFFRVFDRADGIRLEIN